MRNFCTVLAFALAVNAITPDVVTFNGEHFTASPVASAAPQGQSTNAPASSSPSDAETFSPFPAPTQKPVSGVFVSSDPSSPPPVGSSVIPDFNPAWQAAYAKAKAKITSFTLDEKVSVATGVGAGVGRCIGNTPAVEAQAWPGLCLEDSPLGVRQTDFVTVFPAGINTAATFNRTLMRMRGVAMGQEHKGKGINIALGPMMNMGRIAQGGRNWEGFGADPFLAGETAYETILGMQQGGVQACAKHFIDNEQEWQRTDSSSNVDDRTQHEIYGHPFLRSVMAGVASVMCSYNQVNGTYACQNDKMLNDVLKREFGFQGYVMSDWSATHSTLSVMTGLDMTMPGDITFGSGTTYFGSNLTDYVLNGTIPESRIDDMATRIIAGWYHLHQDDKSFPAVNFNANKQLDQATNMHVDVQGDHFQIVRDIGSASTVLLKNVNGALPLNKPRSIVLIGSDAAPQPGGPGQFSDFGGDAGVLAIGWGSGTANFPYLISPYEAIQARAREDHTTVNWHITDFDTAQSAKAAAPASVAIVFINADSGEGYISVDGNNGDRKNLTAWHGGDNLVLAVAAANKNTVVVVHSVGPLIVEPWIDHPNVTAVLWAGLGGQETGNGLVDVLYGVRNPSARLPYTIAKNPSDYSAQLTLGGGGGTIIQIPYTEGLNIDYRAFDANNISPRFEFGFGLSYTTFQYSALKIEKISNKSNATLTAAWDASKPSPNGVGSSTAAWLHEPAFKVTFKVANSGSVSGGEIPQLYVNHPPSAGEPPSLLKDFDDVDLAPGRSKTVTFMLSRHDLSIWDVASQSWMRPQGTIKITIGASSRDSRLFGALPA
ncbi:glycoside hydrolase family 3 protein [Rickenella mellea]|uniref:beta-glucosidase n=1 Tax=Rickenella mellea TaxID=50990 RepID=A0A4Y7Q776_9AGAM|nr:glycoside hydrolase family 3 protein [Rickenella mellea]